MYDIARDEARIQEQEKMSSNVNICVKKRFKNYTHGAWCYVKPGRLTRQRQKQKKFWNLVSEMKDADIESNKTPYQR